MHVKFRLIRIRPIKPFHHNRILTILGAAIQPVTQQLLLPATLQAGNGAPDALTSRLTIVMAICRYM